MGGKQSFAVGAKQYDIYWKSSHSAWKVSVHMGNVLPISQRSGELFLPLDAAEQSRNKKLAAVVDHINQRYKTRVIKYGNHQEHFGFFENGWLPKAQNM